MRFANRAQAAVEYIFIVALALMLIVPASIAFYRFSADSQTSVQVADLTSTANELLGVAEHLYTLGDAWETVEVDFPDNVIGMKVYNGSTNELVLTFENEGPTDIVLFTHVKMGNSSSYNCTDGCFVPITPGKNRIRVESNEMGKVIFRLKD